MESSHLFFSHSLSSTVYDHLRSMVLEPEQGPVKLRLLAAAILHELSPSAMCAVRDFGPPVEEGNVSFLLPVLLAQGNTEEKLSTLTASHLYRRVDLS